MTKLSLKALLGIGGVGLACAVPVGLYYGLSGSTFFASQDSSVVSPAQSLSPNTSQHNPQSEITCREGKDQLTLETPEGVSMQPEVLAQLRAQITQNGKCSFLSSEDSD